ncbi:hypothetical protein ACIPPQ_21370 [Sphingopyxis sp. LARHCG72]
MHRRRGKYFRARLLAACLRNCKTSSRPAFFFKPARTSIARPVNIIVHTLDEVNRGLSRGEYFWVDIARDGILLYDLPGSEMAAPMPLTASDAYEMASSYFAEWLPSIDRALATAKDQEMEGADDIGWRKDAAFTLYQAAERTYTCFLLIHGHYVPARII